MRHSDRVLASIGSRQSAARSRVAASWRRSYEHHGLDPTQSRQQDIATEQELSDLRGGSERLLHIASSRIDQLFGLVGSSGCTVVLTNSDGVILDQRSSTADVRDFVGWGLRQGANWSECRQGTNGIGTCLAEGRNIIIHRDQHFFSSNIAMSCIGAPIYGASGELIGAIDVSSARLDQTEGHNKLIAATVAQTAMRIETETFRTAFADDRVVIAADSSMEQCAFVAVNADDCIIGATRAARKLFGWAETGDLKSVAATDFFVGDQNYRGFNRAEKAALVKAITRAGGNISVAAKALGIGRATLYRRMKRLGVTRQM